MDKIFTVKELLDKVNQALSVRTLYVNGCFGAPLNYGSNLNRYTKNNSYNKNHAEAIRKAAEKAKADGVPIFGGDCHCTYKGFAWGWDAKADKVYGGAVYQSNGLSDCTINTERDKYCEPYSTDFSNIVPGEALFYDKEGSHFGLYIGDGMVAENTPKWDNCFQTSELWNVKKTSSKGRYWWAHAKLLWVDYTEPTPPTPPEPEKKKIVCPCCGKTIWNDGTPVEPVDPYWIYTVQNRDTLWGIAKKYYGSGPKYTIIYEDNKDVIKNPNIICTGWKLKMRKELTKEV